MSRGRPEGDYGPRAFDRGSAAQDQDEDYDWIKYLGEGRSGSGGGQANQPAARPAGRQRRDRQDRRPERRPERSTDVGLAEPRGRRAPSRDDGGWPTSVRADRAGAVVPPSAPISGPAGDYMRPLYDGPDAEQASPAPPAPRPTRQAALPPARTDVRLDTSEYARPLYPPDDTGPVGLPSRRRRQDTEERPGPAGWAGPEVAQPPVRRDARPYPGARPDDTDPRLAPPRSMPPDRGRRPGPAAAPELPSRPVLPGRPARDERSGLDDGWATPSGTGRTGLAGLAGPAGGVRRRVDEPAAGGWDDDRPEAGVDTGPVGRARARGPEARSPSRPAAPAKAPGSAAKAPGSKAAGPVATGRPKKSKSAKSRGGVKPGAAVKARSVAKPRSVAKRRPVVRSSAGEAGAVAQRNQATSRRQLAKAAARLPRRVMVVIGCLVVAAGGGAAYLLLAPQPAHVVSTPAVLGAFAKEPSADSATARALRNKIVADAAGEVKNVVAAVYEQTTGPGTSQGPQVVVFIGGNLTGGGSAGSFIGGFMTQSHGSFTTNPGLLGGQAACAPGSNGGPAECAWADDDTFGVVVSATLSADGLASELRLMRPQVEHSVK